MTILDTFYASGGDDVRLFTLELTCPAWAAPILICNGFTDRTCVTEDARTLTFTAAAYHSLGPLRDMRKARLLMPDRLRAILPGIAQARRYLRAGGAAAVGAYITP